MRRSLRVLAISLAVVLVLLACAAGAFAVFFDANAYRQDIAARVQQRTGRVLSIGELHLTLWPAPGVRLREVALANPAGFGDTPFASVGEVNIAFELLPLLLHRQVEIRRIWIEHANLALLRNAEGQANWADLGHPALRPSAATATPAGRAPSAPADAYGVDVSIHGIEIVDSTLSFSDAGQALHAQLDHLSGSIGALRTGAPVPLKLKGHLDASRPAFVGALDIAGQLLADPAARRFAFNDAKVQLLPEGNAQVGTVDLAFSAQADLHAGTLALSNASLGALGATAQFQLNADGLGSDALHYWGPITIPSLSPRAVFAALGRSAPETPDPNVLQQASFATVLNGGRGAIEFRDLKFSLDQTHASGTAALADIASHRVTFKLAVDQLDLDRYVKLGATRAEREAEKKEAEKHAGEAGGARKADVPLAGGEALDALNVDGVLTFGRFKLHGVSMTDAELKMQAAPGAPKAAQLGAHAYHGTVAAATTLTPGSTPRYAQMLKLQDIDLGPLLTDLTGEARIEGHGNVDANLNSAGHSTGELKRHLNGKFALALRDGVFHGGNLNQILHQANAPLLSQLAAGHEGKQTNFETLEIAGTIVNGLLTTDALNAKTENFNLGGEGSLNLAERTLDYLLKPNVKIKRGGELLQGIGGGDGILIPIHITGSFDAPTIRIDVEKALRQGPLERLRERLNQGGALPGAGAEGGGAGNNLQGSGSADREALRGVLRDRLNKLLGGATPSTSTPAPATPSPSPEKSPAPPVDNSASPSSPSP